MLDLVGEETAWSEKIIGAAIEVHRILGPGLLEKVYEEALCVEFKLRGIPFQQQAKVPVFYKGHFLKEHQLDLRVATQVVVETKAMDKVPKIAATVMNSYLRFSGCRLGLILNFHESRLVDGITRVIVTKEFGQPRAPSASSAPSAPPRFSDRPGETP